MEVAFSPPARRPVKRPLLIALWFGVWIAILTWPVPAQLGSRLIGDPLGSGWRALWTEQQTWTALRHGLPWPFRTEALASPVGGVVPSPSPLTDALCLPLRLLWGPVATHNLVMLGLAGLGIGGGWLLGRRAGLGAPGALVAATVFGFNNLLWTTGLASGAPEAMGMVLAPWVLTAVLGVLETPGPRRALWIAASLPLLCLGNLQGALFLLPLLPPLLVVGLWERRAAGPRVVLWAGPGLGLGCALAVALWRPFARATASPDALLAAGAWAGDALLPREPARVFTASLAGYVSAGSAGLVRDEGTGRLLQSTFAGWGALLLALLGAGRGRLRWVLFGLAAALLATGPYGMVRPTSAWPTPMSWWIALRDALPAWRGIQSPVQGSAWFFAALAVLAGAGAERVLEGLPPRGRFLGALLISAALPGEQVLLGPLHGRVPSSPVRVPDATRLVRELPQRGAVIDWPARSPEGVEIGRYLFLAAWHGRPLAMDFTPGAAANGVEDNPFYAALERVSYGDAYRSPAWTKVSDLPPEQGAAALAGMGFAYLVLHPWELDPARVGPVEDWLKGELPLEATLPDGGSIYRFEAAP